MRQRFGSASIVLLVINVIVFGFQLLFDSASKSFILVSSDIFTRPWIILSSMFMHANPTHLLFNMYALFIFGNLVEQKIGTKRFLGIYFISGIIASIGFSLFQEIILGKTAAALGASGAIMGILGMTIMLFPDLKVLFFFFIPMSMRTAGIIFALVDVFGIFHPTGVANTAHLAGLAAGLLYGWYLLRKKKKFVVKFEQRPHIKKHKDKGDIMLSQEEIDEYLENGRL